MYSLNIPDLIRDAEKVGYEVKVLPNYLGHFVIRFTSNDTGEAVDFDPRQGFEDLDPVIREIVCRNAVM